MRRLTVFGLLISLAVLAFAALPDTAAQDMEAAWEKLGIETYHIVVQDASFWNILRLELWVQEGNVRQLRVDCPTNAPGLPCHLGRISPAQYTISGLFDQVDAAGERLHITRILTLDQRDFHIVRPAF